MFDVAAELKTVWDECSEDVLGSHSVLRYRTETPAHKFESVVKLLPGPRLIEVTSRDGFDDQLAAFLLDFMDAKPLPSLSSNRIRVFATKFPSPWKFECVVIVPPKIARRFEHESAR